MLVRVRAFLDILCDALFLNDWFFIPFFMFGWLPIIVYSKVRSIPEYFEKRFNPSARFLATILLLFYMIGYIGIGFLTLGKAVIPLLPESFYIFGSKNKKYGKETSSLYRTRYYCQQRKRFFVI